MVKEQVNIKEEKTEVGHLEPVVMKVTKESKDSEVKVECEPVEHGVEEVEVSGKVVEGCKKVDCNCNKPGLESIKFKRAGLSTDELIDCMLHAVECNNKKMIGALLLLASDALITSRNLLLGATEAVRIENLKLKKAVAEEYANERVKGSNDKARESYLRTTLSQFYDNVDTAESERMTAQNRIYTDEDRFKAFRSLAILMGEGKL